MRPSKFVIVVLAPAVLASAYLGVVLLFKGFEKEISYVGISFGLFSLAVALLLVCTVAEGLSTRIHDVGIEQTKIFRKGQLLSKSVLPWDEIQDVTHEQYFRFRLIGASTSVDLNLAYFANMAEVTRFINEHLPDVCQKLPD